MNPEGDLTSTLDQFVTSDQDLYTVNGVLTVFATDHLPIFTVRKKLKEDHPKRKFKFRAYGKMDKANFKQDVLSHNWDHVQENNDPDSCWGMFKHDFLSILGRHALYKEFHTREDRKPWVTTEWLENCNKRDNIGKRGRDQDCPVLKQQPTQIRNRVVSMKRELQSLFSKIPLLNHMATVPNYGKC